MKDYVLSRAFDPLLCVVDEQGIAEADLVEGLSFNHDQIRDSWYLQIPWSEFVIYCERLETLAGSTAIDEIGKYLPELLSFLPFVRVSGRVASPKWYYKVSKKWFGPTMFPAVELEEFTEIAPRTLRVVLRIPDELADCPQFFRITASFDREGLVYLGMKPPSVRLDLQPRRGVYTIHYPPSLSLPARLRRAVTAAFASDTLLREYAIQHKNLMESFEAAHQSELSFRNLVERSPDATVIYDESKIHYVNDAMMELLGAEDRQALIGQPVEAICDDPETLMAEHAPPGPRASELQTTFMRSDGHQLQGEFKTVSVHFQDHPAFATIVRDVTLRNEVLARAMEMDRIISMGTLAAGVGHEINNPLTYVHSNLELLDETLREGELDDDALEDALSAVEASLTGMEQIRSIVEDLSSFSRAPAQELEWVELNAAIEPSLRWIEPELRNRARLQLSLQAEGRVWSSPHRIGQIVLNLLLNAAHAIPRGAPDENEIAVRTFFEDQWAVIEVEDSGSGIPEGIREKIFDPFFTTKPAGEGTGLGLFLTKKIVDHLQGKIAIDSALGQGTLARVKLPRHQRSS